MAVFLPTHMEKNEKVCDVSSWNNFLSKSVKNFHHIFDIAQNQGHALVKMLYLISVCENNYGKEKTRPDTRLPQSHAGGQGQKLRSPDHLGRSSEAKNRKNPKKVKCDGRTDAPTDRQNGM